MTFHPLVPYGSDHHRSRRPVPEEGPPFAYTPEHRARLEAILTHYPPDRRRSAILPALYLVQAQQGYISGSAMRHVAEVLGLAPAEVEDVVSYYTMFYTRPVGRFVVQVCRTLSCALAGAERVTEAFARTLGIRPGETDRTGDFTLVEVECLGGCDRAPVVLINDEWHERLSPEGVEPLVDALRRDGVRAASGCRWRVR
jgi:NADH-quinone oxidoreductase subunit E